jgi:L-cysteine/cystine lyase
MLDVAKVRPEIPALRKTVYLNSGFSGPSPQVVLDTIQQELLFESEEGPTAPPVMARHRENRQKAQEAEARLLNATLEEIVLTNNTTHGINIVLNGMSWGPEDEVVTCDLEHGSILVPALYLKRNYGVTVRIVRLNANDSPETVLERLEEAMTPRTKLLALSHIQYCNGQLMPMKEIHKLAHRHGARVLVDGAQSVGHMPVDVVDLDADYYAHTGHKWALGPDGVGALYVKRALLEELEPRFLGGSAASAYDRDGSLAARTDSTMKFNLSTTSSPLIAGFTAALEFIEGIGLAEIWQHSLALGAYARARLAALSGVKVTSPLEGPLTTGLVAFAVEGIEPRQVTTYLWEHGQVVCRTLGYPDQAIRLSLHCFNNEHDVDRTVELVERLVRERLA